MLEAYEAYGDYNTMAELTQNLVQRAAQDALGTTTVILPDDSEYELGGEWAELRMYDSLSDALGEEITPETSVEQLSKIADRLEISYDAKRGGHGKLVELADTLAANLPP
jgi:lysyl-tRNA synthetase class 2